MLAINLICFSSLLNLWFSREPLCMHYLYYFRNSTCSWGLTQVISRTSIIQSFYCFLTIDLWIVFWLRIMNWNFPGLAIIWLPLNHFHAIFRSDSRFSITSFTDLAQLHMVLLSSKLQIPVFLTNHNMSFKKILKNYGLTIESCGTSRRIFNHELKWKQVWLFVFDLRDSLVID